MTQSLNLAVIPGDGIGPEVTTEALETLKVSSAGVLDISVTSYSLGAAHYLETGEILSEETLATLSTHDAILFGAVGGDPQDPQLQGGIIERGLLLKLRFAFDHYVNLRPTVLLAGAESPLSNPGAIDFVVVREGTEGPYVGNGGALRTGTPEEIATEVSVNTAHGVNRVVRFAFNKAMVRRKKLTLVHKTNVLIHAGSLWSRMVRDMQTEFPEVEVDYLHIDAATVFMVTDPSQFDVIVTDNLFGDIITDLAGAVGGGIGMAASANLNPSGQFPSMFEPVHGSAPGIAGKNRAQPFGAIIAASMMLDYLGLPKEAEEIVSAIQSTIQIGKSRRTRWGTKEMGEEVRRCLTTG